MSAVVKKGPVVSSFLFRRLHTANYIEKYYCQAKNTIIETNIFFDQDNIIFSDVIKTLLINKNRW